VEGGKDHDLKVFYNYAPFNCPMDLEEVTESEVFFIDVKKGATSATWRVAAHDGLIGGSPPLPHTLRWLTLCFN
jgi:hypothetical protein